MHLLFRYVARLVVSWVPFAVRTRFREGCPNGRLIPEILHSDS
jgi:hypothetical protein